MANEKIRSNRLSLGPDTEPSNEIGEERHEVLRPLPDETIAPTDPNRGKNWPSVPRGAKPNTAMCEDRTKPGMVDKGEDCGSE